eukprot:TRINITY_DN33723_c0_g1_i1.p1 TRINITY_DN33723_c0_g1~~TRINITY_DN33723_c0_g1_i1.p1  ORF type:complete len:108 (+),score=18.25 TRINITY_DN33723_c0_g1_i1:115-438(+)
MEKMTPATGESNKQGFAFAMAAIIGLTTWVGCRSTSEKARQERERIAFLNRTPEEIATANMEDAYLDHILAGPSVGAHPLFSSGGPEDTPSFDDIRNEFEQEYFCKR